MKHGSLFSGIGGFDLAAEWMGWNNIFHCEWNSFSQKILKYYWPNAASFNDITKTDFTPYANRIDILTGGFPCQPYSLAGKRKGKEDERHLWPEMLRAIREIQPRWVVGENVFGLINWSNGLVFHEVQADLEAAGYEVWPYVLPACAINAPHRRDRVWFVAYSAGNGKTQDGCCNTIEGGREATLFPENERRQIPSVQPIGLCGMERDAADTDTDSEHEVNTSKGGEYAQRDIEQITMHTNSTSEQREYIKQQREREFDRSNSRNGINNWENFPTQSPICTGNDGFPFELDGITFPKWRNESIKAAGNAIVPQVTLNIFKAIQAYESLHLSQQ